MIGTTIAPIRQALKEAKHYPLYNKNGVVIIGASKQQGTEALKEAIAAGITDFGENRVQEAEAKWPAILASNPGIRLHLIGPLQTNKLEDAVKLFDSIHSLDRPKLAQALARALAYPSKTNSIFIQVNTGSEPQKSGVLPEEASGFIRYCLNELKLPITGLMCVPPADQHPAPHFALLRKLALAHGLQNLSMGMSEDYETAVRMGATHIRIGRALFGERN